MRASFFLASLCVLAASVGGCGSTRMVVAEKVFGQAKREQLVSRVKDARDQQEEAKEQFASAFEEFKAVTGATDAELEARYKKIQREYDRSESKAEGVRSRIRDVERVAGALFKEWEGELGQYSSATLREASERELAQTKERYGQLIGAMKQAEGKMAPVLTAFKDQVLYLKHNLNARAIAALQGNVDQLQGEIGTLIREMEASIAEANSFIDQIGKKP
jgi:hypothetical protein